MEKLRIFCVTNKEIKNLEKLNLSLAGVGKKKFKKEYITCLKGKNIQKKEKHYSELTFHYWFWKNQLKEFNNNIWIGFCQKRRFWLNSDTKIKNFNDLQKNILKVPHKKWKNYESIICKPIRLDNPKKMKLIKRGLKNIIKDPSIFFNKKKTKYKTSF